MLRLATVLRCCWLKFENGQIWANNIQHVATRWPNANNVLRPTMLQYVALRCCDRLRLAGALFSFCYLVKVVCNDGNLSLTLCTDLHVSDGVGWLKTKHPLQNFQKCSAEFSQATTVLLLYQVLLFQGYWHCFCSLLCCPLKGYQAIHVRPY